MSRSKSPIDTFLAPLAALALRHPDLEGAVIWGDPDGWTAQDDATETLDAEEIAFYSEGLLGEGFSMMWQAIADSDAAEPSDPDHILLFFWQGPRPPRPDLPAGWHLVASAEWDAK